MILAYEMHAPWGGVFRPVIVISAPFLKNNAEEKQEIKANKTIALIVNSMMIMLFLSLLLCQFWQI